MSMAVQLRCGLLRQRHGYADQAPTALAFILTAQRHTPGHKKYIEEQDGTERVSAESAVCRLKSVKMGESMQLVCRRKDHG